MASATIIISILELGFGVVAALVAWYAWQNRQKRAGFPVFILTAAGCLYAVVNGLATLTTHQELTILFGHLRWPFGALIAVATFYTAVDFTGRDRLKHPLLLVALVGFVAVDVVAFVTNPIHELLLTNPTADGYLFAAADGQFLWVHLLVSFVIAGLGLGMLLLSFSNRGIYREQTAAIIVGIGIAFGFFIVESIVTVHPALNLATIGIILGSTVLLWAINYAGLLETVPIARETLMDNMDEYIIALDNDGRVIDINTAAKAFLNVDEDVLGEPAGKLLADYPDLVEQFGDTVQGEFEFSLDQGGTRRHFHLSISPIGEQRMLDATEQPASLGRLVVVSDITERRRREEELDLLKEVFARVLRHNMRNDLNVIKGNARLLAERVAEGDQGVAETIEQCSGDLLDMSEKARELESIIDSQRERVPVELGLAIREAVRETNETYPTATFDCDLDEEIFVWAHIELETALRNLLENACEHDTDPPTTVEIDVSVHEETVELVISDDGPGIPEHELDVLASEAETSLKHGSGLGLWIVKWVVNRSKATIDITGDGGTHVTISLDRVTEPVPEPTIEIEPQATPTPEE